MVAKPKQMALHGQTDVYITRAEIELKKAMQSLVMVTDAEINSVSTLTALSLPKSATPLFWTIKAFFEEKYQKPGDRDRIHHRNKDARLLYQQLAQLDLMPWSNHLVDYVSADQLPSDILFPIGHPILGRTYRRHPIKSRQNQYYPVRTYFSMLFQEREQSLLNLLGQLGATKIAMTPIPDVATLDCKASLSAQLHHKVFQYPNRARTLPSLPALLQKHPWIAGEPAWQEVVRERLERGILSAQFEFDSDVMGLLKAQLKTIGQLVAGLDSMALPDNYRETIFKQVLQARLVQVEFSEI